MNEDKKRPRCIQRQMNRGRTFITMRKRHQAARPRRPSIAIQCAAVSSGGPEPYGKQKKNSFIYSVTQDTIKGPSSLFSDLNIAAYNNYTRIIKG